MSLLPSSCRHLLFLHYLVYLSWCVHLQLGLIPASASSLPLVVVANHVYGIHQGPPALRLDIAIHRMHPSHADKIKSIQVTTHAILLI